MLHWNKISQGSVQKVRDTGKSNILESNYLGESRAEQTQIRPNKFYHVNKVLKSFFQWVIHKNCASYLYVNGLLESMIEQLIFIVI